MVQTFGSWTALFVARPLVQYWIWGEPITTLMNDIVPPGSAKLTRELLWQACPITSFLNAVISWFSFLIVPVLSCIAQCLPRIPSFDISMCLRKRFFYDRVVEAIDDGAKQVLILGGGYDVLIMNLAARYPKILFVEVDHPSTSVCKQAAVERLGYRYSNARFLPVDLSLWKLEEKIFDDCPLWKKDIRSVIVAEGLFMYLKPEAVRQCLQSIKAITPIGSVLVFSYITKTTPMFGSVFNKSMLAVIGEPLCWTPDSEDEVSALVSSEGFLVDITPRQSDNYLQYLAKYHQLRCYPAYQNKNGIAISR